MLPIEKINTLEYSTRMANCKGCTNSCRLTINKFSGGRQYISGNRCERGIGKEKNANHIPNLFEYKYKKLFDYTPLAEDEAPRGKGGHSAGSEHVRELPALVHLLHKAGLPGSAFSHLDQENL